MPPSVGAAHRGRPSQHASPTSATRPASACLDDAGSPRSHKLDRAFFARDALEVAPDLVGKLFVSTIGGVTTSGWIVETEAYLRDDPACHAYRGMTKRNATMFGPAGHLYVYRSMGIHFCANVVTGENETGQAVLIRALEPHDGIDTMIDRRGLNTPHLLCAGPGRLCQALGISLEQDGVDLMESTIFVVDGDRKSQLIAGARIGISKNVDKLWRFGQDGSAFLSRPISRGHQVGTG